MKILFIGGSHDNEFLEVGNEVLDRDYVEVEKRTESNIYLGAGKPNDKYIVEVYKLFRLYRGSNRSHYIVAAMSEGHLSDFLAKP